jgi:hypothetical protein
LYSTEIITKTVEMIPIKQRQYYYLGELLFIC